MVKLTVLYNLPEGSDHEAFIRWRTGEHQAENAAAPHVLKTDFYRCQATVLGEPAYQYITEAYFASMEHLQASLLTEEALAKLKEDSKRGKDFIFLVSEELASTENS
jgi:hypothetical protein